MFLSPLQQVEFINAGAIAAAFFLALVANRLIEYVKSFLDDVDPNKPVEMKQRERLLLALSFVAGFGLTLATSVDLFATGFFQSGLVSRIATAIVIGGGANLLNDLIGNRQSTVVVQGDSVKASVEAH
jgi:hypothetical protein